MEEARSGKNLRGNRRGYWLRVLRSSFSESNYPVSSYRVAHVFSGNRPRGKWKSKKLAADCVQCAQYKIASQLSRDCYGSFPPSSAVFLAGQLFTPLPTSKRDTLGREQVANMFSYRCGFLRLDTPVFLRLWNRQISFSTMI